MKRCTIFLVFALVLGTFHTVMAQEEEKEKKGKLGEFAGDYEKNKKDKKEKNDEEDSGGGWLNLLVNIAFSPDDERNDATEESSPSKPAPFPYRDERGLPMRTSDYREYSVNGEISYLRFNDGLNGFHFAGDIRGYRLAASLDMHALIEDLGRDNESLTFLGLNAGYEVIATPSLLARPYIGARNLSYLSSRGWSSEFWGPEVGAKLLMLPRKPINIETSFSYARLNGVPLTIASGTLGVMIDRVELRLGGQMFRSDWTTLQGIRLGFRVWL